MRNTSKALFIIMAMLLVWGSAMATMVDDVVYVPKTLVAPVIDGEMDGVWYNTTEYFMQEYEAQTLTGPDDWFDLFSTWRLLWDDENFYVFLYSQDLDIIDEHTNPWEVDSFEIYFDADDSEMEDFDGIDDVQIRFPHSMSEITSGTGGDGSNSWDFVADDIEWAVMDTPDGMGWTCEIKVPMASINADLLAGDELGFEVQLNENDGTARDIVAKWWSPDNNSWNNPSLWGKIMLWNLEIDERLPIVKAENGFVPTIDGEMEDGWIGFPNFNCNEWVKTNNDDEYFDFEACCDDWTDQRFRFRIFCDDDNMYCFTKVWDDVIVDEHTNAWERDGVEFYFDADNSKQEDGAYDGIDDVQIRINHAPEDVTWGFGNGGADWGIQAANVLEYAVGEFDLGYSIEWSLPLADLQIDNEPETEIGFEVQTNENDADARDSMRRWWDDTNDSWTYPSAFGTAVIVADPGIVSPGAVDDRTVGAVVDYSLGQNYPNPFNPVTTIPYSVERTGQVKLVVYDLLGKEVATLVDGVQAAGSHKVAFGAKDMTSGVYFYKLFTEKNVETRKMTLLK